MARTLNPLKLRLLGGFELQSGEGADSTPAGRKVRALLACLALSPEVSWPRERLMALLWSDRAEEQARASLRQALTELRQALGEPSPLRTDQDTVILDAAAIAVDAIEFPRLAKAGKLDDAAALYRGPLLDGHGVRDGAFEDWLLVERTRLHDIAVDVLDRLAASQTGDAAIGTAQRLLQLDPAREEAHRLLMRLYAGAGHRAQALRQYQLCRDALWRDLQTTPDRETERLYREIQDESLPARPTEADAAKPGLATPPESKPSIAVLPFINLSGDPEQQYFSDGTTEDIITELSRFRDLRVISFQHRDKAIDIKRVGQELGVQFAIEGSVRRSGDRVRITAQLIETASGTHLWAERYDRDLADMFALQEELAHTIAATVGGRVSAVGRDRAARLSPEGLTAYDLLLRARALELKFTMVDMEQARALAQQAIEVDPNNARAHAWYSIYCCQLWIAYWTSERDRVFQEAIHHARRAVALDDSDSTSHRALGWVNLFRREYEDARSNFERALDNNPNDTEARMSYAMFLTAIGQPEAALQQIDLGRQYNPFDIYWVPSLEGVALFTARRYEEAIAVLKRFPEPINESRGWLAASYAQMDRPAEAKAVLKEFLRVAKSDMLVYPGDRLGDWNAYWHAAMPYRSQRDIDHLLEGLSKAGMPE